MPSKESSNEIPPRQRLIKHILEIEKRCSGRFLEDIDDLAEKMLGGIEKKGGEFLHNLDDRKDSLEDVKGIIELIPSALTYDNGYENDDIDDDTKAGLPISLAASNPQAVKFVPLLAEEGVKQKVRENGEEGTHGGLLDEYNTDGLSALDGLMSHSGNEGLDVLKKLRSNNLLSKEDIYEFQLAISAVWESAPREIFDFLIDWNPLVLNGDAENHSSLFAEILLSRTLSYEKKRNAFPCVLNGAMRHFPEQVGNLFDYPGENDPYDADETYFERALNVFDKDQTFEYIGQCIPSSFPILHYVIKHAPGYLTDFMRICPDAMFLRDATGRTFHLALLASGVTFKENPYFFVHMSDDEKNTKDPVTDLYPFMLAAAEISESPSPDLDTIYYLLSRNPGVLDESRRRLRNRKRKFKK